MVIGWKKRLRRGKGDRADAGSSPFAGRYAGSGWFLELGKAGSVAGLAPPVPGCPRDSVTGRVTHDGRMDLYVSLREGFIDEGGTDREITLAQTVAARVRLDADGDLVVESVRLGTFLAYRV